MHVQIGGECYGAPWMSGVPSSSTVQNIAPRNATYFPPRGVEARARQAEAGPTDLETSVRHEAKHAVGWMRIIHTTETRIDCSEWGYEVGGCFETLFVASRIASALIIANLLPSHRARTRGLRLMAYHVSRLVWQWCMTCVVKCAVLAFVLWGLVYSLWRSRRKETRQS